MKTVTLFLLLLAHLYGDVTLSDLSYTSDGTQITITDCLTTASGNLVVPSTIDSLPVTAIADEAFEDCTLITSATIPEGVTSIGDQAFRLCSTLTSVTLPESLSSMGSSCFSGAGLLEISVPGGVTSIASSVFSDCLSLESATLEEGITSLGQYAFLNCTALTELNLPSTLSDITLHNSFSPISEQRGKRGTLFFGSCLSGCTALAEVNIHADNASYAYHAGALYSADYSHLYTVLEGVTGTFTMHDQCLTNEPASFYDCDLLTQISFGASISTIYPPDYYYCPNVGTLTVSAENTSLYTDGTLLYSADRTQFILCAPAYIGSLTLPEGVTSITDFACSNHAGLTDITFPSTLTTLGEASFYRIQSLTSCSLSGNMLTTISVSCFENNYNLEECTLPSSVTSISASAFSGCESIDNIDLSSVTTYGQYAFYACESLSSIDLSPDLTAIPDYCFTESGISTLSIPALVTTIGESAFEESSLISISFPEGLLSIGEYAFAECQLSRLTIPASLSEIAESSFSANPLTELTLQEGLEVIGEYAFSETTLTSVVCPSTLETIEDSAFSDSSLLSITLNEGLEYIGHYAFSSTQLTSLYIPSTVSYIGSYIVRFCPTTYIELSEGVSNLENFAFANCTALISILLPTSLTVLPTGTFNGCSALQHILCQGDALSVTDATTFSGTHADLAIYYYQDTLNWSDTLADVPTVSLSVDTAAVAAGRWLLPYGVSPALGFTDDAGSDGISILMEYALGLDPSEDNSSNLPALTVSADSAQITLFIGADNIQYNFYSSSDLTNWSSEDVTLSTPDTDSMVTVSIPTSDQQRYLQYDVEWVEF